MVCRWRTSRRIQDPLVFVAGLSYSHAFEEDGVQPGNDAGLSFPTLLGVWQSSAAAEMSPFEMPKRSPGNGFSSCLFDKTEEKLGPVLRLGRAEMA